VIANTYIIREIRSEDNPEIERVIREVFPEVGLPLVGTAYEDKETSKMFESYWEARSVYYILEVDGEIMGGAGIKPLQDYEGNICELQKMYFSAKARGKGYGKLMVDHCVKAARDLGFEKCYLESASILKTAIHIYEKKGFKYLDAPLGNTGHYSCGVWMIKEL